MRTGIAFEVTAADRTRLGAIAEDRNSPQKQVWRANIILLSGAGCGTAEIMQRTGKAKTCVWRWQERYMLEGVDGLLRDRTRPSRKPPLPEETIARVVELTLGPPPGEVTHWTASAMAKAAGLSASSVQRIWRSHGLQPHRFRHSSCPKTQSSLRNFRISLGFIWRRPPMHSFFPSMKRAKSRLWTAPSPACR